MKLPLDLIEEIKGYIKWIEREDALIYYCDEQYKNILMKWLEVEYIG